MASGDVSSALATTIALIAAVETAKVTVATDQIEGIAANIATDTAAVVSAQTALITNLNSVWGLSVIQASGIVTALPPSASGGILTAIVNSAAALQAL